MAAAHPLLSIRPATADDVPLIRQLIAELAAYERLADAAVATDDRLRDQLFGAHPAAEVLIGEVDGEAAGFALFFHNFSTFLGKRGLYLEDLFVRPAFRGAGLGKHLMAALARIAVQRDCGRFEWSVLDWNAAGDRVLSHPGCRRHGRMDRAAARRRCPARAGIARRALSAWQAGRALD